MSNPSDKTNIILCILLMVIFIVYGLQSYKLEITTDKVVSLEQELAQKNLSDPNRCNENCMLGYDYAKMVVSNYDLIIGNESIKIDLNPAGVVYCIEQCEVNNE